ncbi:Mur ligase family protein [Lutimaribacter marinistellae]|uniref:Mur ligase family protein n=1 Tax=Lutimaribacter marinistellae TaxID=1820329 RepID=A0ABV7TQ96_9RHOB
MTEFRSILWTGEDLVRDLGLDPSQLKGKRPVVVESVEVDSFRCGPGALYVPRTREFDLPDPDQNTEIYKALFRGAAAALTDEVLDGFPSHAPILTVPDRRAALLRLAECGRARLAGSMVAVTGSMGKTTTKDMLGQVLSFFGPTVRGWRNYNGINGIPATLSSIPHGCAHAVVEVAATHPDTVDYKLDHINPDLGILTTITQAHQGNYPSRYDIFREKSKVLAALPSGGPALVGGVAVEMDEAGDRLLKRMGVQTHVVGGNPGDFVRLADYEVTARATRAEIEVAGRLHRVEIPQPGAAYAWGAAFTLGALAVLGHDPDAAIPYLAAFQHPFTQRGARWRVNVRGKGTFVEVIDDSQNATPDSIASLLETLQKRAPKRLVLVLADMAELGDKAPDLHMALAPALRSAGVAALITVGPMTGALATSLAADIEVHSYDDAETAAAALPKLVRAGDLIALKGAGAAGLMRLRLRLAPPVNQVPVTSDWLIEDGVPGRQPPWPTKGEMA